MQLAPTSTQLADEFRQQLLNVLHTGVPVDKFLAALDSFGWERDLLLEWAEVCDAMQDD